MAETSTPGHPLETAAGRFDWPLCYEAEQLLRGQVGAFLQRNTFARNVAQRMRDETGTDFFEWIDHVVLGADTDTTRALREAGYVVEPVDVSPGMRALWHPRAMLPRVLELERTDAEASWSAGLTLRPERLADFIAAHDLGNEIIGAPGARLRRAVISEENGTVLLAVERLGHRGYVVQEPEPAFASAVARARELWRTRRRSFPDDADGVRHAFTRLEAVLALVDRDAACDLFFAEERRFWEARNRAAQIQKRRQDQLGLGWGNHDHHTFRCSRKYFADLMRFLTRLGFEKRERYYAGAEAGWGAQILEQPIAGIVVFADVDLMPEETQVDFSSEPLPPAPHLRTVGLWCALHGDSFLQAGMHHLEARFDFARLRDQLAEQRVKTMAPFSDFEFLRQAFTEGERWTVRAERVVRIREEGLITEQQAEIFLRDGAMGSHLENLQRQGGFKGFNQKSVSAIIAATDPRKGQAGH